MNKKEQHLEIVIHDHRPEHQRPGRRIRRRQVYTNDKEYLADMRRIMHMHGVRLRETTRTVVEIHPIEEHELF